MLLGLSRPQLANALAPLGGNDLLTLAPLDAEEHRKLFSMIQEIAAERPFP